MATSNLSLDHEFEAALAWWRAAGVDCDFADDATAWLAETPLEPAASGGGVAPGKVQSRPSPSKAGDAVQPRKAPVLVAPAPAPETLRRNLLGDSPPTDLAAFRRWWLDAPELDAARLYPRIAPRGEAGAALMVLVPQPDEHDRETLLEGVQGRLLANILAAMGLDGSAVYLASALPCHTPMADLASLAAGGMDAVLAHHIALVAPRRLLVLGTGLAPMVGAANANPLREINHNAGNVPVMVSETLDALMEMPRLKARLWKRWIEWSASQ